MQLELRKLRRTASRRPFLDMTPMIDTVFNLLIFFAVTSTMATSSAAMKVNLPQADAAAQQKSSITISLARDGRLALNKTEITWTGLHRELIRIGELSPDTSVIVRADRDVLYDSVIRVLDEVRGAGLADLSLAVVKEQRIR